MNQRRYEALGAYLHVGVPRGALAKAAQRFGYTLGARSLVRDSAQTEGQRSCVVAT